MQKHAYKNLIYFSQFKGIIWVQCNLTSINKITAKNDFNLHFICLEVFKKMQGVCTFLYVN